MKGRNITNSKYRNTGVLFELLVRQITADTLSGKDSSPAMTIMQRRFNANTEMGKELQLYRAFFGNRVLSESKAIHFIDLLCEQRQKLDDRKLAKEKYELVKEIKQFYPLKEFLSSRDPNYTINASIYKTFASEVSRDIKESILNIREVANARFTLVEHLVGKYKPKRAPVAPANELINEFVQQPEDLRLLTYRVLVEKFNSKYSNLDSDQKTLLREYINNVTTVGTLASHIQKEIPRVKLEILQRAKQCDNKVTQIKLHEVAAQLDAMQHVPTIQDNHVAGLMLAYEIIKELKT